MTEAAPTPTGQGLRKPSHPNSDMNLLASLGLYIYIYIDINIYTSKQKDIETHSCTAFILGYDMPGIKPVAFLLMY